MPILIKNIQANKLDYFEGGVYVFSSIIGLVQNDDYINLGSFIGYLQDFSKIKHVEYLEKPLKFGLKNEYNNTTITIEISY